VLTGQNLWVIVRFSTRAFTWTHASMFTTRSTTRQTVPTKPRQTVLWWRRVQRRAPPFYIHLKYVDIWLHWSCYLPRLYSEMIDKYAPKKYGLNALKVTEIWRLLIRNNASEVTLMNLLSY